MKNYSDLEIVESFFDSWTEGDSDDIKSSLYSILVRFGGTHISSSTGIPRSTLYDMCKDSSNPTLDNLCKIIDYLNSNYPQRESA